MSQKSRLRTLEKQLAPKQPGPACSRELFDLRVANIKHGAEKLGYEMSHQEVIQYAFECMKKTRGYRGLAFDPADVGLEIAPCEA